MGNIIRCRASVALTTLATLGLIAACGGEENGLTATPDSTSPSAGEPATLMVRDARIWTGDPSMPWAEAIASRGETIVAVGDNASVAPFEGPGTEVLTVNGAMLVPGLIDSHVHLLDGGEAIASVQLRDAETQAEFTRRIAEFAATVPAGEWIVGGVWDHENWGGELPRRDWIDAVTPNNPVWIFRLDGHMALANSVALSAAGVDADTPDIDGGEVVRYDDGRPTGLLKDNAMNFVLDAMPAPSEEKLDRDAQAAMQYFAENGITSVQDMANFRSLETYRRAQARDALLVRIYSVVPLSEWEALRDDIAANGRGDQWLRTGGLKGFMDGALGSHTAALFDAFSDTPGDNGFLINTLEDMQRWVRDADAAGLHVMVHAIGDRAIRDLLNIYLDVVEEHGDRDRRFRIEHAQHLHPEDIPRFAAQDVIDSMLPYHAIDDGRWAERVIGTERIQTTYAFRSLMDDGAHVAFGSDWYVAPATPIEGIYAAVTRRTLDDANPDGWVPTQKVSVEQALRAYTYEAAYASFEEDLKGTLKTGMLADFVIIDRDLTAIPAEEIREAKVLRTVVGGRSTYVRD